MCISLKYILPDIIFLLNFCFYFFILWWKGCFSFVWFDLEGASIFWHTNICHFFLIFPDYCTTLEGDDCYSCWRAYFELKDLQVCVLGLELPIVVSMLRAVTSPHSFLSLVYCSNNGQKKMWRSWWGRLVESRCWLTVCMASQQC